MARPRGDDWLEDEMRRLRRMGVDVLVSALVDEERRELGLLHEHRAAQDAQLQYFALPIPDRGTPTLQAALPLLRDLAAHLRDGRHVVVHCRFGIGRSSLLAAAVLVLEGVEPSTAWRRLSLARGLPVPDTEDQRRWVAALT